VPPPHGNLLRRRRGVRRLLCCLASAGLLGTAGCRPPRASSYGDLTTSARTESTLGAVVQGWADCSDQKAHVLTLRPGETVRWRDPRPAARVEVRACLAGADVGGSLLRLHTTRAGTTRRTELRVPPERWVTTRQELDGDSRGPTLVELEMPAGLPAGATLLLDRALVTFRQPVPPRARRRRLVLLSIDTLRADAIAALGGRWATPGLDRLAAASESFADHWATTSWTKPSHASLLTGLPPELHGGDDRKAPLRLVPTLADRLRAAGWDTAALTFDTAWLDPALGFGRGFAQYRQNRWHADQTLREALALLTAPGERPLFLFVHVYDVHSDFGRLPYESCGTTQASIDRRYRTQGYGCTGALCSSQRLIAINDGRVRALPGEAAILADLYGRGVTALDEHIGAFLTDLQEHGLWDDLLLVVTSDHGEALLEHGQTLHEGRFWEEVLRVPLLIKWPRGERAGERTPGPSSAIDVVPTLLAALGLPHDDLPGVDLRHTPPGRPVWASAQGAWRSGRFGRHKIVVEAGRPSLLFDLGADPGETRRLADRALVAQLAGRVERHGQRLEHQATAPRPAPGAPLSAEDKARLRALGYVL
jgi:arylsulfatase A-like enzyme